MYMYLLFVDCKLCTSCVLIITHMSSCTYRELVLIVKPRNLNRINPAPASLSESKLDDPGYMLRESLTILKESLVNGRSLLHYDVRMCVVWGRVGLGCV